MSQNTSTTPDNVTPFREDRRLGVIGWFRSVAFVCLLVMLIYSIFTYREDLNTANIRRVISYIDRLTFDAQPTDTFKLEWELDNTYTPYDVGIAACSGGNFRFIPPFEDMEFTYQVKYTSPVIETVESYLYVYDLGGKGISRLNSYSLLGDVTLESDIIHLSANENGDISVVTDEAGYRTAVTVFSKRFNQLYKWQTSEHFAFLSALSPDSNQVAILCVGQKEGHSNLYIRVQPTDGSDTCVTIDLGDMNVYALVYAENNRLLVLGEKGVYSFSPSGSSLGSWEFPSGSLITFACDRGEFALSLKGEQGDTSRIVALTPNLDIRYDAPASGSVRTLALRDSTMAYLSSDGAAKVSLRDGITQSVSAPGARDVMILETGSIAAVYTDSARVLPFSQESDLSDLIAD